MKKSGMHILSGIITVISFVLYFSLNSAGNAPVLLILLSLVNAVVFAATSKSARQKSFPGNVGANNCMNAGMQDEQNQQLLRTSALAMQESQRAMHDALSALENARLDSTGIEFGGRNCDINLNPSMHFQQDAMLNANNQSFMNNSFMNGPGMF